MGKRRKHGLENCCGEVFVQRTWTARKFCPREGFVTLYFAGRTFVKDSKVYGMTSRSVAQAK